MSNLIVLETVVQVKVIPLLVQLQTLLIEEIAMGTLMNFPLVQMHMDILKDTAMHLIM